MWKISLANQRVWKPYRLTKITRKRGNVWRIRLSGFRSVLSAIRAGQAASGSWIQPAPRAPPIFSSQSPTSARAHEPSEPNEDDENKGRQPECCSPAGSVEPLHSPRQRVTRDCGDNKGRQPECCCLNAVPRPDLSSYCIPPDRGLPAIAEKRLSDFRAPARIEAARMKTA